MRFWNHLAANALTALIVLALLVLGAIQWGVSSWRAPGPLATPVCLDIPGGSSFPSVADNLVATGAIRSKTMFLLGVDYTDRAGLQKAGSFLIPAAASMEEIAAQVTTSGANTCGTEIVTSIGVTRTVQVVQELDPATGAMIETARFDPTTEPSPDAYAAALAREGTRRSVRVIEGTTVWQVVTALNALLDGADVTELPPEGTLAPDQYELGPDSTPADLLALMSSRQADRLAAAWADRDPTIPIATPEEALVLASIVEKETAVPEERPLVASVFENRLNAGMKLQTDPTVIYGVTQGQGVLGRGLRQSELRGRTPWNTYVIDGLPPTPIANPSAEAIQAVVNPAESDYIFFVADGTGGHAFAETLAEHEANVARWREIEAQQAAEAEAAAAATATAAAAEAGTTDTP